MKCPVCDHDAPEGSKFCNECGNKLLLICCECEIENPPGSKFCTECGSAFNASGPDLSALEEKIDKIQRYLPEGLTQKILTQKDRIEGERKQVTVMFCDLVGFTSMSENLDPEEVYSIMDQVLEILIHKVHDFGGTVNKMTGDGIMALFGAPIALEDGPQRAIRSALAIHRGIIEFSEKLSKEKDIPSLKMRVGINTGPVVVGTIGNSLRVEFTAMGDTVNLASRMEGLARPGTTAVTNETFKLTEVFFRFEAHGKKEVKGKEEPVEVYEVISPSNRSTRFDVSAERGLTPLVGRERELELLLDGHEMAKSGRGQAFSIIAEAGIGKSRLLYEFRKKIANENLTILEGKCLSFARNVAYLPVIDILKANFGIEQNDTEKEAKGKVTQGIQTLKADETSILAHLLELLSVKNDGDDLLNLTPEQKKTGIFEAVRQIIIKRSEQRPLILIFEDLHWIDQSSEELLQQILNSVPGIRVLVVFTYRPEYLHTWGGKSYHNQVNLNRLTNRESVLMLHHLLGSQETDKELDELILNKTEGIPFYIEELVKSLKELKIIQERNNRYCLLENEQVSTIPSSIQDVIMARVDTLPENARGVLQIGSAIEREFSYLMLKEVTELPEQDLLSNLSILKDTELIYERGIFPDSIYIFKHAFTKDVVYGSLLEMKKQELHNKIGQVIETNNENRLDEFFEILAYHYNQADNPEKAIRFFKFSGEKALNSYSNAEAVSFFQGALNILKKKSETRENKVAQIEILLLMKQSLTYLGYTGESLQLLHEGLRLSKELSDGKSLQLFNLALVGLHTYRLELKTAIEYAEDMFQETDKAQDLDLIVPPATILLWPLITSGQFEKVIEIGLKVINLIEKDKKESHIFGENITNQYTQLCGYCARALAFLGEFDKGKVLGEKALHHSVNTIGTAFADMSYSILLSLIGDGVGAIWHSKRGIKHIEDANYTALLAYYWMLLGRGYLCFGDLKLAKGYIEKGLEVYRTQKIEPSSPSHFEALCEIHLQLGDLEKARVYAEKALRFSIKYNQMDYEGVINIVLGTIIGRIDSSKIGVAREHIFEGIRISENLKARVISSRGYLALGEVYAVADDTEQALENLVKAEREFKEMGMDYWIGRTHAIYAELYKKETSHLKASDYLTKAIDIMNQCGADGWVERYEKELTELS
jgi:class 3 adenylate cyclase/tetratricopeptide (TPR) repeat protein